MDRLNIKKEIFIQTKEKNKYQRRKQEASTSVQRSIKTNRSFFSTNIVFD